MTALLWLQGENNSVGTTGTEDRGAYVQLAAALQADFNREIVAGIAGQDRSPAVFTHQVSGIYVRDANRMSIPMAQLDCAYGLPNWFLVAPSYPVTEKGGHLDPNGYRWLGQQFGKVMHKVLDLGEGWKPLHPLRATLRGTQVLVDFHVPHPPLVFSPCYVRTKPTSFADGGFSVTDDEGRIGVRAAAVVAETCVLLVLEREPGANPFIWYGDQTLHGGYGNLRDSDPTVASSAYEYRDGTGQYPGANIPELIGKPYPLWNWSVVFCAALQHDPAPVAATIPLPPPAPLPEVTAPELPVLESPTPEGATPELGPGPQISAEVSTPEPMTVQTEADPVAIETGTPPAPTAPTAPPEPLPAPITDPEPVAQPPVQAPETKPLASAQNASGPLPPPPGNVLAWLKRLLGGD